MSSSWALPIQTLASVCHLQGLSGPCLKSFPLLLTKGITLRFKNGSSFGVEVFLVLGVLCLFVAFCFFSLLESIH